MKFLSSCALLAFFFSAVKADLPNSTITAGNGETYTLYAQWLNNSRGYIYCEMIWNYGKGSDLFSTSPLAECNLTWWENLNMTAVAELLGAESSTKNGPQWWSMDVVRVYGSHPVNILGQDMILGASFPPGGIATPEYEVFYPSKTQYIVWKAGMPTYRLNDTDGNTYLLQGYKVDEEDLPNPKFKNLPEGWVYFVENPVEDLIFNLTTANPIPSIQDEFDQIYIRLPVSNGTTTTDPDTPPTAAPPPSSTSAAAEFVGTFVALSLSVVAVGGLI